MEAEHELWSLSSGLLFIIILILIIYIVLTGLGSIIDLKNIKENWAEYRCNPMIMPFASFFDQDAKQNFEFCMGKIFDVHSQSSISSITSIFSTFTNLLQSIFSSISSIRNIIASLGGGINVVFQEFTDRITSFFFRLRVSAIRIKSLFMKMYAVLFSVMYMGMTGISGMSSFTNTFLFSFLDTFCFPGDTEILVTNKETRQVNSVPIKDIKIGDILVPGSTRVTATFRFYSKGQPMVRLGTTVVSTNHYVIFQGKAIKAGAHPYAVKLGPWDSDEVLYCLNTTTHKIPVKNMTFLDYDETSKGDQETMRYIENRINSTSTPLETPYKFKEYGFGLDENAKIKTLDSGIVLSKDIKVGDKLSTGSMVVGVIKKIAHEQCVLSNGTYVTPSTLYWDSVMNKWIRYGETYPFISKTFMTVSFVVVPNSQIELESGDRVRDYMELCSPDSEMYYSSHLEQQK